MRAARDQPSRDPRGARLTAAVTIALLLLLFAWFDVYFLVTDPETAEYIVGRYSLLLGATGAVVLVGERWLRRRPVAAVACLALAWLGFVLGRLLDTGSVAYPWIIAVGAVGAALAAVATSARRAGAVRTAVVLTVVTGMGLLGLA